MKPPISMIVRQLLLAHEYWRMKLLSVDLVILNERPPSYAQESGGVSAGAVAGQSIAADTGGGRLRAARSSSCVPTWSRSRCATCCRPRRERYWSVDRGSLAEQVRRVPEPPAGRRRRQDVCRQVRRSPAAAAAPGAWSFSTVSAASPTMDGNTERRSKAGQWTPAPWINVVCNPSFGFQTFGRGQRLYLVAQQSAEPHHPVVERSCERCAGRGDLRSR